METDLEKAYEQIHKNFFLGQEIFRRPSVEVLFRKIDELESRLTMHAADAEPREADEDYQRFLSRVWEQQEQERR